MNAYATVGPTNAKPAARKAFAIAFDVGVGNPIVVDLDGVVSFDDTALGLLLAAAGRARELGGALEIVCTSDRLLERLAFTRFDRAVTVRGA